MQKRPLLDQVPRTSLAGLPIICLDREGMARAMIEDKNALPGEKMPRLISAANGNVVAAVGSDPAFLETMKGMDAIVADGMPLVFASRFWGSHRLPERVATTDFFHNAAKMAQEHGLSFFMLGAEQHENDLAVASVRRLYPELKIAGSRNGFFKPHEEPALAREIISSGADVLWIGMSVPLAENLMHRLKPHLKGKVLWVHSCGGLFNFLSGTNPRAPSWMQKWGLEWAFRIYNEPKRLFMRYFVTNIQAIWRMVTV